MVAWWREIKLPFGVSGVDSGVGYPEDAMSPLSDNCGDDGEDILILDEAILRIIDNNESALDIFAILFL